jgi:anti-anti-sigma factor
MQSAQAIPGFRQARSNEETRERLRKARMSPSEQEFFMAMNPSKVPACRLKLDVHTTEDATVVRLSGNLTRDAAATFKEEVKALIPQTKRLVLDLSEVAYMDSSGLGAVVGVYVTAKKAGCDLHLINLSKRVRELLGLTHLLSVFETTGQYFVKMG